MSNQMQDAIVSVVKSRKKLKDKDGVCMLSLNSQYDIAWMKYFFLNFADINFVVCCFGNLRVNILISLITLSFFFLLNITLLYHNIQRRLLVHLLVFMQDNRKTLQGIQP